MRLIIDNNDIKIENDSIELDGIDNDKIIEEVLENKDKRLDVNSLQSQYEDTFVDETEELKQTSAGAGLTDND